MLTTDDVTSLSVIAFITVFFAICAVPSGNSDPIAQCQLPTCDTAEKPP